MLLMAINWAQPNDPEKKYPLLGRMRYAWLDENNNIKLLLKDGPNSWSEEKDEIMKQIQGHESLINVEELERDPVYLVATFKPILETHYERQLPIDGLMAMIPEIDEAGISKGHPSIYTHPFDLFDQALVDMDKGKTTSRMDKLGDNIKSMLDQAFAEDQLGDMTKETQNIKIMTVDPSGDLHDKTDEFLKKSDDGKAAG